MCFFLFCGLKEKENKILNKMKTLIYKKNCNEYRKYTSTRTNSQSLTLYRFNKCKN